MNFFQSSQISYKLNQYLELKTLDIDFINDLNNDLVNVAEDLIDLKSKKKIISLLNISFNHSIKIHNTKTLELFIDNIHYQKLFSRSIITGCFNHIDYNKNDLKSSETFLFLFNKIKSTFVNDEQLISKIFFNGIHASCAHKDPSLFYFKTFINDELFDKAITINNSSTVQQLFLLSNVYNNHFLLKELLSNEKLNTPLQSIIQENPDFLLNLLEHSYSYFFDFDYLNIYFQNPNSNPYIDYQKFANKFSEYCTHHIDKTLESFAIEVLNFLILEKNIEQISTTEKILDNFFDVHELFEKILSYKKLQEIPINHTKNNLRQKI